MGDRHGQILIEREDLITTDEYTKALNEV